jgi:hypothetical protein
LTRCIHRGRADSLVVDIYATILKPLDGGEFVVLVSAIPADHHMRADAFPHLSAPVRGLEDARERRWLLVERMRNDLLRRGIHVRDIQLKG